MEVAKVHQYSIDHWSKKVFSSPWFWVVFCFLAFSYPIFRSVNRELPPELPKYYKVPDFKLTNQFGKTFGSKDLEGKVYIASFMFTTCPTVCPGLMEKMTKVQKRIRGVGSKMGLVSFTVDPEGDTPAVLNKYSRKLGANPHVWSFLTGSSKDLKDLLIDGFKVPMGEKEVVEGEYQVGNNEVNLMDIAHTERLVLVGQDGYVRGYYSTDKITVDKLMIDVGLLVNRMYQK